jgi:hypothetical protein
MKYIQRFTPGLREASAILVEHSGGRPWRQWFNARGWAIFWGSIAGGLMAGLGVSAEANPTAPLPAPAMTFALAEAAAPTRTAPVPEALRTQANSAYGKLPLYFEPNQGQTDPQVKFLARGPGYALFLTSTEAVLRLESRKLSPPPPLPLQEGKESGVAKAATPSPLAGEGEGAVLRMKLLGAHASPEVSGIDPLPGKVNYFRGKDLASWHTGIPIYAQVRYDEVYPGIALVYYGHQRQLEYDFVVAPGADPKQIRLAFEGTRSTPRLNEQGDLVLPTALGDMRLHKPVVYQKVDGQRQEVAGHYVLYLTDEEGQEEGVQVGFEVATYDHSRPLIIDPLLAYSTYLGGSNNSDWGNGIAVDGVGQAYVTGETSSADFPTRNALQPTYNGFSSAFIAKLSVDGSALIYATYFAGTSGAGGNGIAVDGAGNAYITGYTGSTDFPTHNALQPACALNPSYGYCYDAFVAKVNAEGSALVYSTYLGGSSGEWGWGIAVDGTGQAYVTGNTNSADFPTRNALQPACASNQVDFCSEDAFVAKVNAEGSALVYSTYLGGSSSEWGWGIAIDGTGHAYVTGHTYSTDFPTRNALQPECAPSRYDCQDIFVAKLSAEGLALVYSTYLGGNGIDRGDSIAVDEAGRAYVTGITYSTDLPIQSALQPAHGGQFDAFVAKLSTEGSALVYSTYLGGGDFDWGHGIAVDRVGQAYVTGGTGGHTGSADFPTQAALQPIASGFYDAFVTKIHDAMLVNALVSFEPLRGTFQFTPDPAGCPAGFVGKSVFDARLTNTSDRVLSDLWVQVSELTQDNRLLTPQGLIGKVASFKVPPQGSFANGQLSPTEFVDVPFTVCLTDRTPFSLRVNVWETQSP